MASTYTAAGIELIAQGEQAGAWGATTNTNWELVEEMIGGVVDITLTGSTYSLVTTDATSSEGRHSVLNFSGSPGATCTVTVTPNDMQKVYFVVNGSDETVTISQGSGANVSVSAGKNKIVFCDGAGAGAAVTDISSGFDATTLAELGVTATATELNYVDGVTSNVQTQLDAMVEKAGDTMTGALTLSADPTSALHAATKQYVDTIAAAGIHYHTAVRVESPSNLNATYDNGTAGVGATLTNAGANAAISIDGVALSSADRVLVYNQTNAAHNGVYTVTTVGDGSTPWVLTRATDADSYGGSDPDSLGEGDAFFVSEGDTGAGELYVMNTSGTITFGTTDITFSVIAETAVYSAGSGLDLNGTEFSHTDTSSQASVNNSGNTFIQDVTVDGFGHVTGLTSAAVSINNGTLTMATSGTGLSGSATFTANSATSPTFTVTSNATNANTASTIVARDGSGNFSAGTITAALSGNASTATTLATARTIGGVSFDGSANINLPGVNTAGNQNTSGNAATATALATARTIGGVSFDGTANINLPGVNTAGNQNTSGNAATATALATARSIGLGGDLSGSANFDGTAGITITASLGANTVDSSELVDNSVDASHLNVSGNGTTSQFLRSDGDGTFTWATPTDTNTTYSGGGNYGIYLSGTEIRLENDRRRNATGEDVYSGNTHDYTFYDASVGIRWYTAGAEEMRLENDGDLHVDGNVTAYSTTVSDERLKTDIERIEGALGKVCALSGYTFTYKHDGKASAGVVAQEVEKVMPSAVIEKELPYQGEEGEQYKIVQYDQLHGLLIEAIKELKAEVAELKAKVG